MEKEHNLPGEISRVLEAKRAAIESHENLRASPGFLAATNRTRKLVGDYAVGLNMISMMATRHPDFHGSRLSIRVHDLLLESAISIWGHINNGLLNPARREMRFLVEASVKTWWCDQFSPSEEVTKKVEFLNDLGKTRFRKVAETVRPRLLDAVLAERLPEKLTNLYGRLSTSVHASTGGLQPDLHRFEQGKYLGFEDVADLNRVNDLLAEVLDISLCAAFEAFDEGLVGDIFVVVLDEQTKWAFHRTTLVQSVSEHYDYKAERQS